MMLIINTARKYSDLDFRCITLGLFESESSPVDISENLDFVLEDMSSDIEITTLNDAVINRVGYLISMGYLDSKNVVIKIYENGSLKRKSGYDEEGCLDKNWIVGLYNPPEKPSIKHKETLQNKMVCKHCGGTGFVQIGPNVRGIKKCPYCK